MTLLLPFHDKMMMELLMQVFVNGRKAKMPFEAQVIADSELKIGDRKNFLVVKEIRTIKKVFKTGTSKNIKEVFCECDCGISKWIRYEHVKADRVKSCGCLNYKKRSLDSDIRAIHHVMTYTLSSA